MEAKVALDILLRLKEIQDIPIHLRIQSMHHVFECQSDLVASESGIYLFISEGNIILYLKIGIIKTIE
jgi:hypothetical protein